MSLIERWWRIDFHDHSEWTSNEENARDASEHYDYPLAGPFVLEAQQPRGAVDALSDLLDALDDAPALPNDPTWAAIVKARGELRRLRGGSR